LAGRWLSIFAVSFGLFLIRFLVPVPVGQADNRDGPRLMCSLGVGPVTDGYRRYFRYAYFEYVPKVACEGRVPYPSSELVPLTITRVLTPLLALSGTLNLIALGLVDGDFPPSTDGHPLGEGYDDDLTFVVRIVAPRAVTSCSLTS
jgi:hypothetical protein